MESPNENKDKQETSNSEDRAVVLALNAVNNDSDDSENSSRPPIVNVYTRRSKRPRRSTAPADSPPPPAPAVAEETAEAEEAAPDPVPEKQWVRLSFRSIKPKKFVGLECKIFWPEDVEWYRGHVVSYDPKTKKHRVDYDDGDVEDLILKHERIRFFMVPPKN